MLPDDTSAEFHAFFQRHYAELSRLSYLLTGETDAADDLAADALIALWQRWDRLRQAEHRLHSMNGSGGGAEFAGTGLGGHDVPFDSCSSSLTGSHAPAGAGCSPRCAAGVPGLRVYGRFLRPMKSRGLATIRLSHSDFRLELYSFRRIRVHPVQPKGLVGNAVRP